jgi:ABC-type dipeptide/oligopeptide/nickel transport system permease subunit
VFPDDDVCVRRDERTANPLRLPSEQVLTKSGGRTVISVKSIAGGAILAAVAAMAVGGVMLAPEAYLRSGLAARFAAPDMAHWLGRDELGRNTLNRLLAGATTTVSEALAVVVIALCVGLLLDLMRRALPRSGIVISALAMIGFIAPKFLLGWSRAGDVAMAALSALLLLPGFIGVIAAVALLGPGAASVIIAFGLLFAVAVAYSLAAMDGVDVAGNGPAVVKCCAALALRLLAWAMLSVSALDTIGLGTQPPRPSWGTMLGSLHGLASLHAPVILAGACLLLAAIAAIMLGDALRQPHSPIDITPVIPGRAKREPGISS